MNEKVPDAIDLPKNSHGRFYHIDCRPGDLAPYILACASPGRAHAIADLLDEKEIKGRNREYVVYTGVYKGVPVSVMGTGIGAPATAIAIVEAAQCQPRATFIRVGTCGALQPEIEVGDLILTDECIREENTTHQYADPDLKVKSDPEVLSALQRAAEMINKARRPILYLGGGVIHSQAGRPAVRLAEKCSMPVTMTLMGLGAIPMDHPYCLGMLGMHAARYTNLALEECDVLIVAGARFDDRATGKVSEFCPNTGIIHIDIDHAELDKIRAAHVGILGDVGEVFQALLPMVDETRREDWITYVAELKKSYPLRTPSAKDLRTPHELIVRTAELIDHDTIVATDVGQHQMWTAQMGSRGQVLFLAFCRCLETVVALYGITYRALVVHFDAYDERRQKQVDKQIAKEREQLARLKKRLEKIDYGCLPDAEGAAERASAARFHEITISIQPKPHIGADQERMVRTMRLNLRVTGSTIIGWERRQASGPTSK